MNASDQIKAIEKMYDRLHFLNNYRWPAYRDHVMQLCKTAENEFRKPGNRYPDVTGFTVTVAGKLFTNQYILEGMIAGLKSRKKGGPTIPMSSIHGLRYEYLYGRSIGAEYCHDIAEKISSREAKEYLSSVDYCDLM